MPEAVQYYCGRGPVPRGKKRGTPEYCLRNNQVRYYGIVAIDPALLDKFQTKALDLVTEQLRLKKLENLAKILIKDVKHVKIEMENEDLKASRRKQLEKKMANLLKKRDKMLVQLRNQRKVIAQLEEERKQAEKQSKQKQKKKKS